MTNEELERLEALARAATPGLWRAVENKDKTINVLGPHDDDGWHSKVCLVNGKDKANAAFIAAANPATILSLIQRVKEADRLLKIESGIRYAAQQNFLNAFANGHAAGRAEALGERDDNAP